MSPDLSTDVVIVGGGSAALAAALTARRQGLEVTVICPSQLGDPASFRGASGRDLIWLPDPDYAKSRPLLDDALGGHQEFSTAARRHAFLAAAVQLTQRLDDWAVGWTTQRHARAGQAGQVVSPSRAHLLAESPRLVDELARAASKQEVTIWQDTQVVNLISESGGRQVSGVRIVRAEVERTLHANRAVVLAGPGFGADAALRREQLPAPTRVAWSKVDPAEHGWSLRLLADVDADLANMAGAWRAVHGFWPNAGGLVEIDALLASDDIVIIDATGQRIDLDADQRAIKDRGSAAEAWHAALHARQATGSPAIPAWLLADASLRRELPFPVGRPPRAAVQAREIVVDDQIAGIANGLRIDPRILARNLPLRSAPQLRRPPFHALQIVPTDFGTRGGAAVDEASRVLQSGQPIDGLFAVGAAAASIAAEATPADGFAATEALAFASALDFSS